MNLRPALALIEFDSIAVGTFTGDAMAKKAPIDAIQAGTIQPGKYLVLIGGSVAAVEESFHEGLRVGGESVLDKVFLPDAHDSVAAAVAGTRQFDTREALGVVETSTVAAIIACADAGVKGAEVTIIEIRLGDGLGGKGIVMFCGTVADVQAAVEIGLRAIGSRDACVRHTIIPSLSREMSGEVAVTTRFHPSD